MAVLIIALVTLVVTLAGVVGAMYYGHIGTRASKRQERQEQEINDWQLRHEAVALQLSRINRHLQAPYPDGSKRIIYTDLFPDARFRLAIEHYIVELDKTGTIFSPRKPTPFELQSPALRETVTKLAEVLDALQRDNPTVAGYFKG